MKRIIAILVVIGMFGVAGAVYASSTMSPAEIASKLTGKSVDAVEKERAEGKTYGTIAKDAGKLEEFQSAVLAEKKLYLDTQVKEGQITQQQADEIYNNIKANQAECDGTGNGGGQCNTMGSGSCGGAGNGMGKQCGGNGMGMGGGRCGLGK